MSNNERRARVRMVLAALVTVGLSFVASLSPTVVAGDGDSIRRQEVQFGLPRTQIVYGLDLEASCGVDVSFQPVSILDGSSDDTFLALDPSGCAFTAFVLGVPLALPILDTTPMGRYSFYIPQVSGLTWGLADVSIDLTARFRGDRLDSSEMVSSSAPTIEWSDWGPSALSISARTGGVGDSLSLTVPYRISMTVGIGVSVYFLGFSLLAVDLVTLGALPGSPTIEIPVLVDRKPSQVATNAQTEDAFSIHVGWTENRDSDFASYRIQVAEDNGTPLTVVVDDRTITSQVLPARPGTTYSVSVFVIDRAGQVSTANTVTVQTPLPPAPVSPSSLPFDWTPAGVAFIVGLFVGLLAMGPYRRQKGRENRGVGEGPRGTSADEEV